MEILKDKHGDVIHHGERIRVEMIHNDCLISFHLKYLSDQEITINGRDVYRAEGVILERIIEWGDRWKPLHVR